MKESQPTACVFSGLGCRQRASMATCGDSFFVSGGSDFRGDIFRLILSDLSLTGKRKIPKTRFLISRIRVDFSTKKFKPKGQPSRVGGGLRHGLVSLLCIMPIASGIWQSDGGPFLIRPCSGCHFPDTSPRVP